MLISEFSVEILADLFDLKRIAEWKREIRKERNTRSEDNAMGFGWQAIFVTQGSAI